MRTSVWVSGALALAVHALLWVAADATREGDRQRARVQQRPVTLRPPASAPRAGPAEQAAEPAQARALAPADTIAARPATAAQPAQVARLPAAARPDSATRASPAARSAIAPLAQVPVAAHDAGAVAEAPLPIYLTRPPPAFSWSYRLQRGTLSGRARLDWQPHPESYALRFVGRFDGAPAIDWSSRGAFDAAGLAPRRFTVQRNGRPVQAANFRRDADRPVISYSGPALEHPLPDGAQDRLSWIVQLASIAAAEPQRLAEEGQVVLFVSGARGDAGRWTFNLVGRERLKTSLGAADTIRLLREAQRPYDTRAEVWLDPARHHLPVRARLANFPAGEALELLLEETP